MTDQTAALTPATPASPPPRERIAVDARPADATRTARQGLNASDPLAESGSLWSQDHATGGEDLSFEDFLDIINPLHHIPVVGAIYRHLSGDTIAGPASMLGGLLYGGPIGMALAGAGMLLEEATGDSLEGHIKTALGLESDRPAGTGEGGRDTPAPRVATAGGQTGAGDEAGGLPPHLAAQAARDLPTRDLPTRDLPARDVPSRAMPAPPLDLLAGSTASTAVEPGRAAAPAVQPAPGTKFFPIHRDTQGRSFPVQPRSGGAPPPRGEAAQASRPNPAAARAAAERRDLEQQLAPLAALKHGGDGTTAATTTTATTAATTTAAAAADKAAPPAADQRQQALSAQGLVMSRPTPPAARSAAQGEASPVAAQDGGGPVEVPAWFDSAMQKAIANYQKTGSLGGAAAAP